MANKPELLVTAGSAEEMKRLIEAGADAVNVGEQTFGLRLPGDMTLSDLQTAIPWAHERGAKVYVSVNHIMDNDTLRLLPDYLKGLETAGADAVVFGDPAVLMAVKQHAPSLKLHWNAEMTSTNYATANYWGTKGASRVVFARELNMEQILEAKKHLTVEAQVQVHGMTNIYHSKRSLLSNYAEHLGKDPDAESYGADRGLFLIEQERPNEHFPVFEDRNGTHIMSSDDVCMIENLPELIDGGIDSFKIEGLLKPIEYNETVVRCYRAAIDAYVSDPQRYCFDPEWLERIQKLQPADRELSYGFFYKEQVY
jgi:putative protease